MPARDGRGFGARHARAIFLLAGVGLTAILVWRTGWPAVQANLASIGWRFFGLVALYLAAEIAFVLGWRAVMEPHPPLTVRTVADLLRIYLAGNTLNYLAPGSVAGEPVRASMLGDRMETSSAIASVTIFKHAHMVSQAFFVASGLAVALIRFDLPGPVRWTAIVSLLILCGLVVLVTWGLHRGSFGLMISIFSKFKPLAHRLERYREPARVLDRMIRRFYDHRWHHFFAAAGWCLLGWCGGLLETYLVLRLLAPGRGWETAFAVESLAMLLNNMFLFVPGRAGTAEGVRTGVFLLLGLPGSTGFAYGLVRRGRELLWVLPGLVFLAHRPSEKAVGKVDKAAAASGDLTGTGAR